MSGCEKKKKGGRWEMYKKKNTKIWLRWEPAVPSCSGGEESQRNSELAEETRQADEVHRVSYHGNRLKV